MTAKQEPEYIITESQLKRLTKSIIYGGNNYLNSDYCLLPIQEARFRPHSPLTQDTTGQEKPDCEGKCCPSGIVQGKEVLCRAESYMCEYQCPIDGANPKLVCTRDSVEQEKTQAPATGRDSLDTLRDWVLDRCSSGAFFTLWEINHKINEIRSRPHLISPRDKSHSPCLHYGVCRLIHGNTCLLDDGEDCNHVLISPLTQDTTPIFEKLQHPTIHVVKSWTRYFNAMQDGSKKFDKRVWDRDYQVGDTLIQEEWNKDGGYTGKSVGHVITYILTGEFAEPGICVMSVDGVEFETRKEWGEKIRQDEREKVLDMIGKGIMKLSGIVPNIPQDPNDDRIPEIGIDELGYLIKSLRTKPEGT